MAGIIQDIYVATGAGLPMTRLQRVEAISRRGLAGDRYCEGVGLWSEKDPCEVTLIEGEKLEDIARQAGIAVLEGQHRRNLVTRAIRLDELCGEQFKIGTTVLEFAKPRPPCEYLESITEAGMMKELAQCGGICARVIVSGQISVGDPIELQHRNS